MRKKRRKSKIRVHSLDSFIAAQRAVSIVHSAVITASTARASTLRGYRGVGDVTFDLSGSASTDVGWVIFEVNDSEFEGARGLIGTFNNYVTLMLIRFERAQKPCRIQGWFDDGATGVDAWRLDDVTFTGFMVRDPNGLVGFRAGEANRIK